MPEHYEKNQGSSIENDAALDEERPLSVEENFLIAASEGQRVALVNPAIACGYEADQQDVESDGH